MGAKGWMRPFMPAGTQVAGSAVRIVSGEGARVKVLAVEGMDEAEAQRRLGPPGP